MSIDFTNITRLLCTFACLGLVQASAEAPWLLADESSNPRSQATQSSWVKDDNDARVVDLSDDESLALLWNGQDMLSVANLETGQLGAQLPSGGGGYMRKDIPNGQFSADKMSVWILYADYYPVETAAEARRLLADFEAEDQPEYALLEKTRAQQLERYRSILAGAGGSFLVKWDLNTGESVAEMRSPGRSILAFDQKSYQSRYLVTLEGVKGDDAIHHWVCVYDTSTNKKLAETAIQDIRGFSNFDQSPLVDMDENDKSIVVSIGHYLLRFRFSDDLVLLSRTTVANGGEPFRILTKNLQYPFLYLVRKWPQQGDATRSEWEIVRHLITDQQSLKSPRIEIPSDHCTGPYLSISKDGARAVVSTSFEHNEQSWANAFLWNPPERIRTRAVNSVPHAVLNSGQLVTPTAKLDASGQWLRGFSLPSHGAPSPHAVSDRVVTCEKNVIAASDSMFLEISRLGISVASRGTGVAVETLSPDNFGCEEGAFPEMVLTHANAVYAAADQSFYIAVPLPSKISEHEASALFDQLLASTEESERLELAGNLEETLRKDAAEQRMEWEAYRKAFVKSDFFKAVASELLGEKWAVFVISEDGRSIRKVQPIERSPVVRLAAAENCVGLLVVSQMNRGIQCTTNFGGENPHTTLVPGSARNPIVTLNAVINMVFAQKGYVLHGISVAPRIVFVGDGDQFFYANASFLFNDTRSVATMRIDENGEINDRRTLLVKSTMVAFLESMKPFMHGSQRRDLLNNPLLGMITQPLCVAFDKGANRLCALQFENDRDLFAGAPSEVSGLARAKAVNVTLSEYPVTGSAVPRHSAANWMLPGLDGALNVNSELRAGKEKNDDWNSAVLDHFPRKFVLDSSSNFCVVSTGGRTPCSQIFDRSARRIILEIEGAPAVLFLNNSVVVNGTSAPLSSIKKHGAIAFKTPATSRVSPAIRSVRVDGVGTCYFVGVGCTKFTDPNVPPLQYTADDVNAMAAAVGKECQKQSREFLPAVLVDGPNIRQSLGSVLFDLERNTTERDSVVIAISSHGVRLNRGLYVITPETNLQSPQATAIGWPEFVASLARIKAGRMYVFLDVCHAASFSEANISILQSAKRRLEKIPGLVVIASSKPGESSFELDRLKHGVFTHALLECLSKRSLFEYEPNELVSLLSEKTQDLTVGNQTPVLVVNNVKRRDEVLPGVSGVRVPGAVELSDALAEEIPHDADALAILMRDSGDGFGVFRSLEAKGPENLTRQELLAFTTQQLAFGNEVSVATLSPFFAEEESLPGLCERAVLRFMTGEKQLAISTAKQARDRFDSKLAWHVLDLLMSTRDGCTNEEYLQFTLAFKERFPDFEYALAAYGNGLKTQSHLDAIKFLQTACARFPKSTRLLNYLGHSQASVGQFSNARETYDQAIELDPGYGNLYSMRGMIAFRQGDMARFEEDWLLSAKLSPNELHSANRIQINLRRGLDALAYDEADMLFKLYANDRSAALLAYTAFRIGNPQRSKEVYLTIADSKMRAQTENLLRAQLAKSNLARTDRYLRALNKNVLFVVAAKELETCAVGIPVGVTTEDVAIKSGKSELGRTGVGRYFRIQQENGDWLLGDFWENNQKLTGWVHSDSVRRIGAMRARSPSSPGE